MPTELSEELRTSALAYHRLPRPGKPEIAGERGHLRNGKWRLTMKLFLVSVLLLLLNFDAKSQQPSPTEGKTTQPQRQQTQTSQQSPAADQRGTEQMPFVVKPLAIPKTREEVEQDRKEREAKAANDQQIVEFNRWLVVIGGAQLAVFVLQLFVFSYQAYKLRQTVESSEKAIAVTRAIGEAQVRAYVSIKSVAIYFGGNEAALPFIDIVAINNGQSPAFNFVWAPEVHYLPETRPEIVKEVHEEWMVEPGLDIHSASESNTMYVVHDFDMVEKIAVDGKVPERMAVSITIHYSWSDVFGKTFIDYASFAGVAEIGDAAENQRMVHELNTSPWACRLNPIAKNEAWTGIMVKAPEKKAQGSD